MELCTHQVKYNGLCAVCGTLLETDTEEIRMGYDPVRITVSREEAEKLEAENTRRLLKDKKLSLIIDLDQTIIHTSTNPQNDTSKRQIQQLTANNTRYYIKQRPGLNDFLQKINAIYELHIYTMGTREYAEAVTNLIDPDGIFFKERILSRDESGSLTQKKLHRLFPCDTSMVVVLDDRSDVWSFSPNLIRIKPYDFFANEPVKDQELSIILKILEEIHETFYLNDKESDVTQIIPKMKMRVLEGKVITFSDRILSPFKDPTLSWIWQMACSFGATCSTDLTGKTTHLIAIQNSRNKVKAAIEYGQPNLHIVTPAWLLDSTARWTIQPEEDYPLNLNELESIDTTSVENEDVNNPEYNDDINWDETNREVEDFINESGIDDIWDTEDSDTIDSSRNSSVANTPKVTAFKRKLQTEKDERKTKKRGKSQLSKVISATSSQCTSGNTSDNEDSSLDDFAVILDETLE